MAKYIVRFEDLVAIARRVGVTVVEAPSSHRGHIGEMGTVVGIVEHHTGTPNSYRPADEYPDFNVVKEGRAGLENSLSAFGLGRHTTIYVFSEDISWHAGVWLWKGITDGNGHFLGIEAAGVGDWTPFQRAAYPRLVASILLFIDADISWAPRHLDGAMPPGRKVDAANFNEEFLPGKNFDQSVQWLLDNPAYININYSPPEEDDDMAGRFVTAPGTHPWFLTDGLHKRQVAPGEQDVLLDNELARKYADGRVVKVVDQKWLDRIPNA